MVDINAVTANLAKVVAQTADVVAEVAEVVAETADAESADAEPLDLAGLQSERLEFAAESLGLEGMIDLENM